MVFDDSERTYSISMIKTNEDYSIKEESYTMYYILSLIAINCHYFSLSFINSPKFRLFLPIFVLYSTIFPLFFHYILLYSHYIPSNSHYILTIFSPMSLIFIIITIYSHCILTISHYLSYSHLSLSISLTNFIWIDILVKTI